MSEILDQFGKPAAYCPTPGVSRYDSANDTQYRMPRPMLDYDIALLLPRWKHRLLLSDSRYIATTFPLVGGAVEQKADYVCGAGWDAQFMGDDTEWGALAEAKLKEADQLCDLRGWPFTFEKNMHIGCGLFDIDGDWFVVKAEHPDFPGFPSFQFIEAHRVSSRDAWSGRVQGGVYDGARILNGIIYDDHGAEIAYNVLGSSAADDRQISSRDMYHIFDPRWYSDGRALPSIAYSVLDWYDVKETREAEKIAQKANSSLAIIEETATGNKNINNVVGNGANTTTPAGLQTELLEKGLIRYIKSGSGSIKAHESNRPSDGAAKFERTIVAGAFYGMGWRLEMMDLSQLTGAGVRGFQDNINTVMLSRWKVMNAVATKLRLDQVAKLIERGDLPEHPEWAKWSHAQPPEFTVDAGRTSAADRDDVRAGVQSMPSVIRRTGRDPEDVLTEQAKYLATKKKIAAKYDIDARELGTTDMPGDPVTEDATDQAIKNKPAQP